jgi:hypothetical protein
VSAWELVVTSRFVMMSQQVEEERNLLSARLQRALASASREVVNPNEPNPTVVIEELRRKLESTSEQLWSTQKTLAAIQVRCRPTSSSIPCH